jgi:hypothetical protein
MIFFGDSNESAAAFIGDNLSLYQSRWLKIQCETLRESRAQLLEAILKEWLLDHPEEASRRLERGELARRAMNDFMLRHHSEFLPVSPSPR